MADLLQIRRGTEAERAAMSANDPAPGEPIYTTDTKKFYIGDSAGTAGGVEVAGGAGSGDVVGPTGAVDGNLASFNTATGKLIKDTGIAAADVSAKAAATDLNTSHRTGDGSDHTDVAANTAAAALNTTHRGSDGKDHSDVVLNNTHRTSDGSDHANVAANTAKLAGIEAGAEVNNISDVNATDLTDAGDSALHYHATDRARANHTGTQAASTISDFDTEVSNNAAVAANTAKVTNATHTGDVTGSDALTIAAGAVDIAHMSATGTPDGTTYLRGDNTWSTVAGSGDVSKVGTPVDNQVGVWTGDGTIEGTAGLTYDGAALNITGNVTLTGTVDGIDIATDVAANTSKLAGIDAGATDDQTGAEIKAAYEAEADTNAFTDADHTKLDGIAAGATVDQNTFTSVTADTGSVSASSPTSSFKIEGSTGVDTSTAIGSRVLVALEDTIVTPGSYDNASITVDQQGRLTAASSASNTAVLAATTASFTTADETKLDGLVSNVTTDLSEGTATETTVDVNSSDGTNATLVSASTSRAGLLTKAKFDEIVANTAKTSNATHTGDVTGSTVLTIGALKVATGMVQDDAITYAKMQNVSATDRLLGRDTAGAGVVEELTPAAVTTMLGLKESIQIQIELTVGEEIQYVAPFDMTITGWTMLLDVSGSAAIDVWKDTYANHPPTDADSLLTPSVTTAAKNQATSLSHTVTAGDCIIFHVDSVTTATLATLALTGVRT